MKRLFTLAALLVLGASLQAADEATAPAAAPATTPAVAPAPAAPAPVFKARLDITSADVPLKAVSAPEGGRFGNASWGKEEARKLYLTGDTAPLVADQWVKATFKFMPESDGSVNLNLMGQTSKDKDKKKMNAHWIYFDMITVEGATLTNGDFEEADNGIPSGWVCSKDIYITSGVKAFSGNAMVKAWHNRRCTQVIEVKKDQPVTVTVNVKMGEFEPATE